MPFDFRVAQLVTSWQRERERITFISTTVVCNTLGVLNALRRDRESLIDF